MQFSVELVHRLAGELQEVLIGSVFNEAYTVSEYEILLKFSRENEESALRFEIASRSLFIKFYNSYPPSESNARSVFKQLDGNRILEIKTIPNDRVFILLFDNDWSLEFKLFGSVTNIILRKGQSIEGLFRESIASDRLRKLPEVLEDPPPQSRTTWFVGQDGEGAFTVSEKELANVRYEGQSLLEAVTVWSGHRITQLEFQTKKDDRLRKLQKELKRLNALLNDSIHAVENIKSERSPEEYGHIILSGLHKLKGGEQHLEFDDIYNSGTVNVTLNKDLSGAENAELYFRKAKNRVVRLKELIGRIPETEKRIVAISAELEKAQLLTSVKELKRSVTKKDEVKDVPFTCFSKDGFEIWVGKNAANNDLLTTSYAAKEDIWLHARGVSGSHVIIRSKGAKLIPQTVIELAAQIAAHYSKARGSSWVPVAYTFKKFVRKPRKAAPGAVVLEREEVIMVQPGLPA